MIYLDCNASGAEDFLRDFQVALGIGGRSGFDAARVRERLDSQGVRAVSFDNGHRLIRPAIRGQQELESVISRLQQVGFSGTWIFSVDRYAWRFVVAGKPNRAFADTIVELPPWTEEELQEYIEQRCEELAIEPDYRSLTLPRQYLDAQQVTPSERNRAGLIRLLNDYAEGNLTVVLKLWAESLSVDPQEGVVCALPSLASPVELDALPLDGLLVLRVIAQFERARREDIQEALRLSPGEVDTAVRTCLMRGWLEETDGFLSLDWRWFPVITRVLARQNLLAR